MEVVIAGGHGKVALRLARSLTGRGDRVRSLIRDPAHADDVRATGAEAVLCDLESAGDDELASAVGRADAVVFAAGAGPGSGPARKETVDYGAAVRMIRAARANGIRRYVIVSSIGADATAEGGEMGPYFRAKGRADDALRESGLDFTIVRPGHLVDERGTGRVAVGERVAPGDVPRDDVAAVIGEVLHRASTIGQTFELVGGDVPIEEALGGP
jgi:cytosine deaminase